MLKPLLGRQWWWVTLFVIAAVALLARLGIWQLDRLAARRAFNARVSAQLAQPPLELSGAALESDLAAMEYRTVVLVGNYDFTQQVALRNQAWDDGQATVKAGVHLLTPLVIAGTEQALLVDRGWIPQAEADPARWARYEEPGTLTVRGVLRRSQAQADFGSVTVPEGQLPAWNLVKLPRIAEQVSHPLLRAYVQQAPDPAWTGLPYRTQPELDLSEGPHFGYALQWFGFATVLALGYPFYVRDTQRRQSQAALSAAAGLPSTREAV